MSEVARSGNSIVSGGAFSFVHDFLFCPGKRKSWPRRMARNGSSFAKATEDRAAVQTLFGPVASKLHLQRRRMRPALKYRVIIEKSLTGFGIV